VKVKGGDYLIAVNGREVKAPDNLFSFFENTAEKIVGITVSPNPIKKPSSSMSDSTAEARWLIITLTSFAALTSPSGP